MVPTHHGYPTQEGEPPGIGEWIKTNIAVISLLVAVFAQTSGIIWWASGVNAAGKAAADSIIAQNVAIEKLATLIEQNGERLTRVQVVQENVVKILDQISHRQIYPNVDGPPRGP